MLLISSWPQCVKCVSTYGAWRKWPLRWHFQMDFLKWKTSYFDSNFTEVCSRVRLTITQDWFRQCIGPKQSASRYLKCDYHLWRHELSLGHNRLIEHPFQMIPSKTSLNQNSTTYRVVEVLVKSNGDVNVCRGVFEHYLKKSYTYVSHLVPVQYEMSSYWNRNCHCLNFN